MRIHEIKLSFYIFNAPKIKQKIDLKKILDKIIC